MTNKELRELLHDFYIKGWTDGVKKRNIYSANFMTYLEQREGDINKLTQKLTQSDSQLNG